MLTSLSRKEKHSLGVWTTLKPVDCASHNLDRNTYSQENHSFFDVTKLRIQLYTCMFYISMNHFLPVLLVTSKDVRLNHIVTPDSTCFIESIILYMCTH